MNTFDKSELTKPLAQLNARMMRPAAMPRMADRPQDLLLDHLAEPDDRMEGRAERVAHVREKARLGGIGDFRIFHGAAQVVDEAPHLVMRLAHRPVLQQQ